MNGKEILKEILTSVKGHNSITNVRKLMCNNPNLDLVSFNAYAKIGKILSICSEDIEQKQNYDQQNDRQTDRMMDNPKPV